MKEDGKSKIWLPTLIASILFILEIAFWAEYWHVVIAQKNILIEGNERIVSSLVNTFKSSIMRHVGAEDTIAAWLLVILTSITVVLVWRTLSETQAVTEETKKLLDLEKKPFLFVELIDGASFRIDAKNRVGTIRANGNFNEQGLMFRIVNGGRTAAVCTRLCRSWEIKKISNNSRACGHSS